MTTDEFWNKYIYEDILEIFDITCDFFSKELPKDFTDDCDVSEVIIETNEKQQSAKNFDNVLRFTELLQNKQPKLYEENFQYFDDFLIDLHCFQNEPDKVYAAFLNFIKNPIQDIDIYLRSFKKLLFYGHANILKKAIVQNYKELSTSEDIMGGTAQDLAVAMLYISLEEVFRKGTDGNEFNTPEYLEKLEAYDFDFSKEHLAASEVGFKRSIPEENMEDMFIRDRDNYLVTLQTYFLKYMHNRKFPFVLSGRLWDKLLEYWEDNATNKNFKPNEYFSLKPAEFEKYIARMAGDWFVENKSEMVAVLWGSVYVYDFLKSIDLIDQKCYDHFVALSRLLKGKVIGLHTSDLWNYNFVHVWHKPDGITNDEFNEEEKIFRKSRFFKAEDFSHLKSEISEELSAIGELSEHIIKGGAKIADNVGKPAKAEPKIGRNEPCPCGSGKKYKKCCGK